MPRRPRHWPSAQVIIPDTSILWCDDKKPVVNPAFDNFWANHQKLMPLRLKIPEVVKGELLFQQVTSAEKHFEKTLAALNDLCAIVDFNHELSFKRDEIKAQICQKFDKWMARKLASVLPLPEPMNWTQIAEASIWRKPPFVFDPKNSENEKGFRDALILETVCDYATRETENVGIAFVCSDKLLLDTAKTRLTDISNCACYESLSELSSYLKLTHERHEKEFTTVLLSDAAKRFFTPNDQHCVWTLEKIPTRITSVYENELKPSPEEAALWEPLKDGTWIIHNPQFYKRTDDGTYHWRSPIAFIRPYKHGQLPSDLLQDKSNSSLLQALTGMVNSFASRMRMLLQAHFVALWSMKLDRRGSIRSVSVKEITFESRSFKKLDDETRKKFNLMSM
jgi:hypothetical protein